MGDWDIAVVGMAGVYSGADDPEELWRAVRAGRELNVSGPARPGYITRHGQVRGIDEFDEVFFAMSPSEARLTDPQHRLLLRIAFRAIEDAGYADHQPRPWGVFTSSSASTYLHHHVLPAMPEGGFDMRVMLGNDRDTLATRVAYKLNLQGPALNVQTACSSSLVALHLACQNLLDYECDGAVVGAVSLTVPQDLAVRYQEGAIFSADGYCRPFDACGTGTVKGNGCSAVVLKRRADAEADGDRIHALIRATAVNNDGSDKIGYTAPSLTGEERVIRSCLAKANVTASEIDYVEAHGTGTALGDPIEMEALARVFSPRTTPLPVGSIKGNIGHLDSAAGLTSVVKAVYMLRDGVVPPLANFERLNPAIDNEDGTFEFPTAAREAALELVSVSSYGMGGTNAHAIVQRPASSAEGASERRDLWPLAPLILAGVRECDLDAQADALAARLRGAPEPGDVAFSYAVNRGSHRLRRAFLVDHGRLSAPLTPMGAPDLGTLLAEPDLAEPGVLPVLDWCRAALRHRGLDAAGHRPLLALLALVGVPVDGPEADAVTAVRDDLLASLPASHDSVGDPLLPASRREPALRLLFSFVAEQACAHDLRLAVLFAGSGARRTGIPGYPLSTTRHWVDRPDAAPEPDVPATVAPAAPADGESLADLVCGVLARQLGVPTVSLDDDFFDLGGDSLLGISVVDELSSTLKATLDFRTFLACDTVGEAVALVESAVPRSEPDAAVVAENAWDGHRGVPEPHPGRNRRVPAALPHSPRGRLRLSVPGIESVLDHGLHHRGRQPAAGLPAVRHHRAIGDALRGRDRPAAA